MPDALALCAGLACGRSGACVCRRTAQRGAGLTHCPAHEDRTPSLNVTQRDGTVLVHCQTGCSQENVVGELRRRGLWPEPLMRAVLRWPMHAKDPAELLTMPGGDAAWEQAVADAMPLARLMAEKPDVVAAHDLRMIGLRLERLSNAQREAYLRTLADDLDTPVDTLRDALREYLTERRRRHAPVRIEIDP